MGLLHKKLDIIQDKEKRLGDLQNRSTSALDVVTRTINNLTIINEEIDVVMSEIDTAKQQLSSTESDLVSTKDHNTKIIAKFRSLIED